MTAIHFECAACGKHLEVDEVGVGMVVAERLQGGHGHDGVAEPVDATDEDAGRGLQYPISNDEG